MYCRSTLSKGCNRSNQMTNIANIMTDRVFTLTPDNTLDDIKTLMTAHGIRHIPIVNTEKSLLGIVSQRDVLAVEESILTTTKSDKKLTNVVKFAKPLRISEFYKTNVLTVQPDTTVHQAALCLQKHKIGCLPVVSNNKLVGMVTDTDFVNVAINLMEVMEIG